MKTPDQENLNYKNQLRLKIKKMLLQKVKVLYWSMEYSEIDKITKRFNKIEKRLADVESNGDSVLAVWLTASELIDYLDEYYPYPKDSNY